MNADGSSLLCCPKCKKGLQYSEQAEIKPEVTGIWRCPLCGVLYFEYEGYIHFVRDDELFHRSKREKLVRSIYAQAYTPLTNLMYLPCGGTYNARKEVLEQLEIPPGASVLETGIGTGDNITFLNSHLDHCLFYGLDNQKVMLRKCLKNSRSWEIPLKLYRANAEELPFRDNMFDVVFHLGAINLFRDQKQAIDEMIRVAKPGTKIVIADESEKATKWLALFVGRHEPIIPPVHLVDKRMQDITLREIWKGYGFLITFRKPFSPGN